MLRFCANLTFLFTELPFLDRFEVVYMTGTCIQPDGGFTLWRMEKLYKRIEGVLHYHEAWTYRGLVTEHWGVVGERGNTRHSEPAAGASDENAVAAVLQPAREAGYAPVDMADHARLIVEYAVDGFGTGFDLDKRHALEDRLNEITGWTGLGYCVGGSIGSGTMEACCFVVDFEIGKRVVAAALATTKFADFARIYDEDANLWISYGPLNRVSVHMLLRHLPFIDRFEAAYATGTCITPHGGFTV